MVNLVHMVHNFLGYLVYKKVPKYNANVLSGVLKCKMLSWLKEKITVLSKLYSNMSYSAVVVMNSV
jgi:hypothetical protein